MVQRSRHGKFHTSKPSHFRHPKSYKVICWGCGKEVTTPVLPPEDKKLLCIDCFNRADISKEE